jgi:hypothetical protein
MPNATVFAVPVFFIVAKNTAGVMPAFLSSSKTNSSKSLSPKAETKNYDPLSFTTGEKQEAENRYNLRPHAPEIEPQDRRSLSQMLHGSGVRLMK